MMKTFDMFNQRILLLLLSLVPFVSQALGMVMEKRGVQSQATCLVNYGWMDNSVQQSPCYVAGWLLGQCNEGDWTVFANTVPTNHYNTPNATTANRCSCSWAVYNTLQACALCQVGVASTISTWTQWSTNCSSFLSSPNPWPKGTVIPNETAIPFWATTDPNTWPDAKFDGSTAQNFADENQPDITNATFNGPPSSSSSHSAPVGAIAGGVVGGVLVVALLALGLFYLSCRRRSAAERRARARGVSVLSLTTDAQHARTPSDGTTTTTLFGFGPGVGQAGQKYGVPGYGYVDRGRVEREFTSPLMSGTPESGGGVSMMSMTMSPGHQQRPVYQQTPSFGASTSTSMLMAPGTTPSPAPGPVPGFNPTGASGGMGMLPPGMVSMSVSPMMGIANPDPSRGGTSGAGGSVNVSASASGGAPHSPPNPSMNSVSFTTTTRPGLGHEHSGSNTSAASGVYSGHGHSFSIAGSGESELPEGAISPFIFPQEDATTPPAPADDPFGASAVAGATNKGSPGTGAGAGGGAGFNFATSTPLRKPHEPRARINPPAYSPTASPEENMFASGRPHAQQHLRSTSLSFTIGGDTLASNEATGAESSMGLSGTTLGSGGARSATGGAETLQGTVRSPSPVDEAGEQEFVRERDENGFIVDQKI